MEHLSNRLANTSNSKQKHVASEIESQKSIEFMEARRIKPLKQEVPEISKFGEIIMKEESCERK